MKHIETPRRSAFTLVEILVVLAIIGILAAILFPVFKSAQEGARQTNCASNLNQVYIAVKQYHDDNRRYPDSLLDLLPEGAEFDASPVPDTATPVTAVAAGSIARGTGYLKGGNDILLCLDDEVTDRPKSSYGALTKAPQAPYAAGVLPLTVDAGRYVFNYYGYRNDGFILNNPADVATGNPAVGTPAKYPLLANPDKAYDVANPLSNPVRFSLSNRFAPTSTIITHCVYHRVQTANDVAVPAELYKTTPASGSTGARDIILRLDGTAKTVDVSGVDWFPGTTAKPSLWQIQR